jgi:hypothetical protein
LPLLRGIFFDQALKEEKNITIFFGKGGAGNGKANVIMV